MNQQKQFISKNKNILAIYVTLSLRGTLCMKLDKIGEWTIIKFVSVHIMFFPIGCELGSKYLMLNFNF